jgi:hypothetical protein
VGLAERQRAGEQIFQILVYFYFLAGAPVGSPG